MWQWMGWDQGSSLHCYYDRDKEPTDILTKKKLEKKHQLVFNYLYSFPDEYAHYVAGGGGEEVSYYLYIATTRVNDNIYIYIYQFFRV